MRFAASSLLLHALWYLATASPIDPSVRAKGLQSILREPTTEQDDATRRPEHKPAHFNAAPNSVGLLLTRTGAPEVVHVWLPLGKRVDLRDSPTLPLHPMSARVTTLIRSSPRLATPERLNEIECTVHLHVNDTSSADSRWEVRFGGRKKPKKEALKSVTFGRTDGLVRFADAESKYWLGGAEVEAYECS